MGYLIAVIAAVFLLSVVFIMFAGGRGRTLETKEEQAESHGLGPEQPQDEGATLPQARERMQESEPETRS